MKFGYLRKDGDGHNYVVPEELIEEFDKDYLELTDSNFATWEEEGEASSKWNAKWWDYSEGGSVDHYKVVLSGGDTVNKLTKLCAEIFAHDDLDFEVTLGGNGTNASEASNVAVEILEILGLTFDDIRAYVKQEIKLLRDRYG